MYTRHLATAGGPVSAEGFALSSGKTVSRYQSIDSQRSRLRSASRSRTSPPFTFLRKGAAS